MCIKKTISVTFLIVIVATLYFISTQSERHIKRKATQINRVPSTDSMKLEQVHEGKDSKTLRLLIWEGHAPIAHLEDFESYIQEKYNKKIKFELNYISNPDDLYNTIREKRVDLVMMSHHFLKDKRFQFIENKLLIPLDLNNIPSHKFILPELQKAKYHYRDHQVYASPVSQGPYGLAYNTTILNDAPKSWNILWDPRYKGKYVIGAKEYIYNCNITALAMGYSSNDISNFDKLNNNAFKKKLKELAANAHSFWIGVDSAEALKGKTLAAVWGDSMKQLKDLGEPWRIAEPQEKTPCWIDNYSITWALSEKPFMKKVAEEYINKLLSVDYQIDHIMRNMSLTPIIYNIDNEITDVEKKRLHYGKPNFFAENRILQHTYSKRDRNGLKLLWKQAMDGAKSIEVENQ